jgi:hypothetical protein
VLSVAEDGQEICFAKSILHLMLQDHHAKLQMERLGVSAAAVRRMKSTSTVADSKPVATSSFAEDAVSGVRYMMDRLMHIVA